MTALTQDLGNIRAVGVQGTVQGQDPYFDWNFRKISKPITRCARTDSDPRGNLIATLDPPDPDPQTMVTDYDHIYYIQEAYGNRDFLDQYFTQKAGTRGYDWCQYAIPYMWRNMEPFYIEIPESPTPQSSKINWNGDFMPEIDEATDRFVWANIIYDISSKTIQSIKISDEFYGTPIESGMTLMSGQRLYIFRIDHCTSDISSPSWWNIYSDPTRGKEQIGVYNSSGDNVEKYYYTPGASYFFGYVHFPSQSYMGVGALRPSMYWLNEGKPLIDSQLKFNTGGCLSSLYIPCARNDYEIVAYPTPEHIAQGVALAQEIFESTNMSDKSWIDQNVSFCADGLFAGSKVTDASRLELPCRVPPLGFYAMFRDCSSLIYPPKELPALTIYPGSYGNMFFHCENLIKSPIIYANRMLPLQNGHLMAAGSYSTMVNNLGIMQFNRSTCGRLGISFANCPSLESIYIKNTNWFKQPDDSRGYVQGIYDGNTLKDWNDVYPYSQGYYKVCKLPAPFIDIYGKDYPMSVDFYMRQRVRLWQAPNNGNVYANPTESLSQDGYPPSRNVHPVQGDQTSIIDFIINDYTDAQSTYIANIYNIDDPQYHLQN